MYLLLHHTLTMCNLLPLALTHGPDSAQNRRNRAAKRATNYNCGRESAESEEFPGISGGFRMQAATLLQCLTVPPSIASASSLYWRVINTSSPLYVFFFTFLVFVDFCVSLYYGGNEVVRTYVEHFGGEEGTEL